jgi:hypothetical protein
MEEFPESFAVVADDEVDVDFDSSIFFPSFTKMRPGVDVDFFELFVAVVASKKLMSPSFVGMTAMIFFAFS